MADEEVAVRKTVGEENCEDVDLSREGVCGISRFTFGGVLVAMIIATETPEYKWGLS